MFHVKLLNISPSAASISSSRHNHCSLICNAKNLIVILLFCRHALKATTNCSRTFIAYKPKNTTDKLPSSKKQAGKKQSL